MEETGIVLAGGASRGAYEAGVLRFLYCDLPDRLGFVPWPRVVSGTSVGAINGSFVAARLQQGIDRLVRIWESLRIEDIYTLHVPSLATSLLRSLRGQGAFALLDPAPLHHLLAQRFPRAALREAIAAGTCRAFIVGATELTTGENTLWVDSGTPIDLVPLPGARIVHRPITAEHCIASAALPFVFPPYELDGLLYVDGGLRQNTPLRPLIQAGAHRALVIGVARPEPHLAPRPADQVTATIPLLFGKIMDAALLDPVIRDVHHAERMNAIIAWGREQYGQAFADHLAIDLGVHEIDLKFVFPSEDLGAMAFDIYRRDPPPVDLGLRWQLSTVADRDNTQESDLLSYLFFDRAYTGELVRLGYEDAKRREEELVAFLTDDGDPP